MTPPDDPLDILDRAHAASAGGEWCAVPDPGDECEVCSEPQDTFPHMIAVGSVGVALILTDEKEDANAAFIVAAHNLWPAVAEELRALREALGIIATCPPEAVHLMPLAAQAALAKLAAARGKGGT